MQTVKMSEDIVAGIRYWLKQNKVDGIWFGTIGDCYPKDRYLKVTLTKNADAKTWRITRIIDTKDSCICYYWDYFEDMAKQLNDGVEKIDEEQE